MESAPAAASSSASIGPHVLVPISHPDSPVPTYAVLQFLGFSSPSSSVDIPSQSFVVSPNFALPHLQVICASPTAAAAPSALAAGPSSAPPTPPTSLSLKPSESSSSSDGARDDGPTPRERDREKKFVSLKPSPMKKAGVCSGALSPGVKKAAARVGSPNSSSLASTPPVRTISVSQTERETIVHTHSSNFREVVHQLTGASSDDKDLLPVTMPARTMSKPEIMAGAKSGTTPAEHGNAAAAAMTTGRVSLEPAAGRRPAMKLLERRRSSKVLERLTTSCRELPPLVPSPVTPLASDFEKICLPVTPTTSQSSTSLAQSSALQDSNMVDAEQATGKQENEGEAAGDAEEQARKGFFLPAHRPKSGPTLLHLFPESPRE